MRRLLGHGDLEVRYGLSAGRGLDTNPPFRAQMGFDLRLPDVTGVPRAVAAAAVPGHHDRICFDPPLEGNCFELSVPFAGVAHVVLSPRSTPRIAINARLGKELNGFRRTPHPFVKAIDRRQQCDLRSREFDPVPRAPLAQSPFLGLVRKIGHWSSAPRPSNGVYGIFSTMGGSTAAPSRLFSARTRRRWTNSNAAIGDRRAEADCCAEEATLHYEQVDGR